MVYMDALAEAKRNISMSIALVVSTITDKETRQRIALSFADMLAWGDGTFNRAVFLACCGAEDREKGPYLTLAEEM